MSRDPELFENPNKGLGETIRESAATMLPGLSLSKIFSEVGNELSHMASQGSHEIAAALFHGNGFVMYPRAGQEGVEHEPMHGPTIEPQKEIDNGREM